MNFFDNLWKKFLRSYHKFRTFQKKSDFSLNYEILHLSENILFSKPIS